MKMKLEKGNINNCEDRKIVSSVWKLKMTMERYFSNPRRSSWYLLIDAAEISNL